MFLANTVSIQTFSIRNLQPECISPQSNLTRCSLLPHILCLQVLCPALAITFEYKHHKQEHHLNNKVTPLPLYWHVLWRPWQSGTHRPVTRKTLQTRCRAPVIAQGFGCIMEAGCCEKGAAGSHCGPKLMARLACRDTIHTLHLLPTMCHFGNKKTFSPNYIQTFLCSGQVSMSLRGNVV